jgi:hypothetical protein
MQVSSRLITSVSARTTLAGIRGLETNKPFAFPQNLSIHEIGEFAVNFGCLLFELEMHERFAAYGIPESSEISVRLLDVDLRTVHMKWAEF